MVDRIQVYRSDFILPLISFVIIVIVWMWIIYALVAGVADSLGSQGNAIPLCDTGDCPTDKVTGEKKCPENFSERYAWDPTYQNCQPEQYCVAPNGYAVLSDGSTDSRGYCGYVPGSNTQRQKCRCLPNPYCAQYISNYFTTVAGNAYVDTEGENNTYAQNPNPAYNNGTVQNSNQTLGMKLSNPASSFCTIPINWIYSTVPGCSYVYNRSTPGFDSTSEVENTIACLQNNPCNAGVLSFLTDDSASFTSNDIGKIPVACVYGKLCNKGRQISIFDTRFGENVCRSID